MTKHSSTRVFNRAVLLSVPLATIWMTLGCGGNQLSGGKDGFSAEEWGYALQLEPLAEPLSASPFNEYWDDPAAAELGQRLFFDKDFATAIRLEGPSGEVGETGQVSCASCHDPEAYFIDSRPTGGMSHGTGYSSRNSPSLVNVAYYEWFNWGGRRDSLAAQGGGSPETGTNAASTRLLFAHVVYAKHKDYYEEVFGSLDSALDPAAADAARFPPSGRPKRSGAEDGPWETMAEEDQDAITLIMANSGKAFEAYERNLISGSSPFSRYLDDPNGKDLNPSARRGLALFIGKAACNECHTGPVLSDNGFHNVGVSQAVGDNTPPVDEGRFQDVPRLLSNWYNTAGKYSADPEAGEAKLAAADPEDTTTKGEFRTAGLLNIAETGPYFHNGSFKTLNDVIQHYNRGGGEPGTFSGELDPKIRPLGLTDPEVSDLVEFLRSLTGEPVPQRWRDDPFAGD